MSLDHFIIGPWDFSDVLWKIDLNLMFQNFFSLVSVLEDTTFPSTSVCVYSHHFYLLLRFKSILEPAWENYLLLTNKYSSKQAQNLKPHYSLNKWWTAVKYSDMLLEKKLNWSLRRPEVSCRWQFLPPASFSCSSEPRTPASVAGCCCANLWAHPPVAGGQC